MKFSPDINLGNVITLLALFITFFSKSGKWFVSIDRKLDELADSMAVLKSQVERNGKNNNAMRIFSQKLIQTLSQKHPEQYWPQLEWHDTNED